MRTIVLVAGTRYRALKVPSAANCCRGRVFRSYPGNGADSYPESVSVHPARLLQRFLYCRSGQNSNTQYL